jgi:RNA polymerase sigma-70 factor (ECF subfamily)
MQKPWTQLQDALLAERINQGDSEAFAEAYDRYAPRLHRHLLLRTSDKETAEDLLSKVFLRAWEYVREGKTLRYLQSFLYTVTNNILTDHYRRSAHAPLAVEDVTAYDRPGPDETIPAIDAGYDRAVLEAALGKIRTEFRDVLVMRYIDDLSIGEIARIMQITPNTVYVRNHRALKALREHLDPKYAP